MILEKVYIPDENVIRDVCIRLKRRKGYIKPLFVKDAIPTIIRAWTYEGNIVRLY